MTSAWPWWPLPEGPKWFWRPVTTRRISGGSWERAVWYGTTRSMCAWTRGISPNKESVPSTAIRHWERNAGPSESSREEEVLVSSKLAEDNADRSWYMCKLMGGSLPNAMRIVCVLYCVLVMIYPCWFVAERKTLKKPTFYIYIYIYINCIYMV